MKIEIAVIMAEEAAINARNRMICHNAKAPFTVAEAGIIHDAYNITWFAKRARHYFDRQQKETGKTRKNTIINCMVNIRNCGVNI